MEENIINEVAKIGYQRAKKTAEINIKMAEALQNTEFVAFQTYVGFEMRQIKEKYAQDEDLARIAAATKDLKAEAEKIKRERYPEFYAREKLIRELRKAVIALIVNGEPREVCGARIDTPATALKMLMGRAICNTN